MQIALILTLALLVSSAHAEDVSVRGELVWTSDSQTLAVCDTGKMYWVRVLASNPWFDLTKRVKTLGSRSIVAEFRGEVTLGRPSSSPPYKADGTLTVSAIGSVEQGSCDVQKHNKIMEPTR